MRWKFELVFVFTFMLFAVFSLNLTSFARSGSVSVVQEGKFSSQFWFTFGSIEWGGVYPKISTQIEGRISALPYNYSSIEVQVENSLYRYKYEEKETITIKIDGGQAKFNLSQVKGETFAYWATVSTAFQLFGLAEFYPFDIYMINLTISLPNFGLINETNTNVDGSSFEAGLQTGRETFSIVWDGELARLYTRIVFGRPSSVIHSFFLVMNTTYLLLGSMPLIKPEKLEYRLTICLTLFIFSITFTSTIAPPVKLYRWSVGESLVNALIMGTGFLAVASVIEKALIDARPRLSVLQYVLEGLFLAATIGSLSSPVYLGWFAGAIKDYPWTANPSLQSMLFSPILAFLLAYGYAAKTFVFVVKSLRNLWRKRTLVSERIKSVRLFHRKAKSS